MSSFEISSVAPVEFKKFKPLENYSDTSEQEILQAVDKYLADLGSLVPPVKGVLDIETLKEELKKVRKTQLAHRKLIVQNFKEQLNNKRLGMACCRMLIEGLIDQNPNIRYGIIFEIIYKFSSIYRVSYIELEVMIKSLKLFEQNRDTTYRLRKHFSSNDDLINFITNTTICSMDKNKVETTPYGFIIYLTRKQFEYLGWYGMMGCSERYENKFGIFRVSYVCSDGYSKNEIQDTIIHELQHTKTYFFSKFTSRKSQIKRGDITSETEFSQLIEDWENFLYIIYQRTNDIFSSEIFSNKNSLKKFSIQYFIKYYSVFNKRVLKDYKSEQLNLIEKISFNQRKKIFNSLEKYWRNKSKETLVKAYRAFLKLIREKGLSIDEAVAVLSYLPLEMWEKAVNRLDAKKARRRFSILGQLFGR